MSTKENIDALQAILEHVSEARRLSQAAHEAGEYHLTRPYQELVSAEKGISDRIYNLRSYEAEQVELAKRERIAQEELARKKAADAAAAEQKAAADKAAADAEKLRVEKERVMRVGTPEERLRVRSVEELKLIVAGMKLKGIKKDAQKPELISAILAAEAVENAGAA